jgi:hypothetical protein
MAFSSALVLTDLNDYISPSQACIKPVEVQKKETSQEVSTWNHIMTALLMILKALHSDFDQGKRGRRLL